VHRGRSGRRRSFAVDASLIAADANKHRSIPGSEWSNELDAREVSRASKEYLATLDDAAFGAASDVTPKFVSPSDPAAQWTGAMRGAAFFAYADNYLIDVKFGVIMDVEASRAIRQAEVRASKTMIERTEACFDIKPKLLAADMAYGSGANLNWLVKDKKIAPHIPVIDQLKRDDGTFSREDFTFDKERNVYTCPGAKFSRRRAGWSTMGRPHCFTSPACSTAVAACSGRDAVQRWLLVGSRAASTRRPATLPARWPRQRRSSNHAVTGSVLRCCSHI
jgi:hypothetical protein